MKYVHRYGKRITVETINTATPEKRKPSGGSFVMLPNFWIDRLRRARKVSTVTLAHVILREEFKHRLGGEIVLSTEVTGLSRQVRARAVNELRELGLIETELNGNQAVRVISIIKREEKKKNKALCSFKRDAALSQT
jgi:hypothetical protein